jgi:WD40 repeat protein
VYYNPDGKVVYMTACLGVILDQETNTQTFFGGGAVENKSKQVANDVNHHTNDIMSMNVNTAGDREWAVTGQVGKSPPVFVWNTRTGEKKSRLKLAKAARAVAACAISTDCTHVATVDKHNDHNVAIWDAASGQVVYGGKGGPDPIWDVAFTKKEGEYDVFTAGKKHFAAWSPSN